MKIIQTDNYAREIFDDKVIAENIDKIRGEIMVNALNDNRQDDAEWFLLVEDNHVPFTRDY